MALTCCKEMVSAAYQGGYAIAQINTNGGTYDLTRAILEAAEETRSPVLLGCYEANAVYAGYNYLGRNLRLMIEELAPSVPIAIHLDHGSSFEEVARAIQAGFTSVMYDGSKRPLAENITESARVAELAHSCSCSFEAELGQLLSGEFSYDNPNLVSLDEVKTFTQSVPMDMLAVAIGNSHGYYKNEPKLNMRLLEQIRAVTQIPLVLHGTTGLDDAQVRDCISLGMAKVNLATALRMHYLDYYREGLDSLDHKGHPWRVGQAVKDRLKVECISFFELIGSTGKA